MRVVLFTCRTEFANSERSGCSALANSLRIISIFTRLTHQMRNYFIFSHLIKFLRCSSTVQYRAFWSPRPDLNRWPLPYQGSALPTELRGQQNVLYYSVNTIVCAKPSYLLERETGFEPATLSLEGWRSSQLSYSRLWNQFILRCKYGGEGRIRTSEGWAGRFTVCPLWPLGNLSPKYTSGAGDGTWTRNLLITNQLLCHWATPA